MSYCRFSSQDFTCDLYCYQSDEGWVTHVASNRAVGNIPKGPDWLKDDPLAFSDALNAQLAFLDSCERKPIGLPHDGASFIDGTLVDFRERLTSLRTLGYRFPDGVLESVDEEIRDEAEGRPPS